MVSEYEAESGKGKQHHRYANESNLNVIQENPAPYVPHALTQQSKKDTTIGGVKARIHLNTKPLTANNSKPPSKNDSFVTDLATSKQTPKSNAVRKTQIKHSTMTNSKIEIPRTGKIGCYVGGKTDRLTRRLEMVREEFERAGLRRHN